MRAVHSFVHVFGYGMSPTEAREMLEQYPPVEHPVVRTHPETGRKTLFVNSFFTEHIVGLDDDESEWLLDRLAHAGDASEWQVRLRWEPGTVAFWDNRSTQHYASSDYYPQRRVMERVAIKGDRPFRRETRPSHIGFCVADLDRSSPLLLRGTGVRAGGGLRPRRHDAARSRPGARVAGPVDCGRR